MKKDVYEIYKSSWSFNSSNNEKYIGTIEELKETREFKYILKNKRPRTLNGLQKILNSYAKEHRSTYRGIEFDIFVHYGEYKAGLQN